MDVADVAGDDTGGKDQNGGTENGVRELTPYMPLALAMRSQTGGSKKQGSVPPRRWEIEMFSFRV